MALEHAREALAHLLGWRADHDGAGDVGRAVLVLPAGIDEEKLAWREPAVALAGNAVVDDRAVRSRPRDGGKGNVLQEAGRAAEIFQGLHRIDLGQPAARGLAVEPGEEAGQGRAVAPMRRSRARDLGRVLERLHRRDRIGSAHDLAARLLDGDRNRLRRGRLIESYRRAGGGARGELSHEGLGRRGLGQFVQCVAHIVAELARVGVERRTPVGGNEREGERHRGVRNVAAADVEGPGERGRIGDDEHVGLLLAQVGLDARKLVGCGLAGIAQVVQRDRAERLGGTAGPDCVDHVRLGRDERSARLRAGGRQPLHRFGGVQPGIITECRARGQVRLQPFVRRRLDPMHDLEQIRVDLFGRLQRVAAVDEQGSARSEHDRDPGRPGEAGQPAQTLVGRGHIFVLVSVAARHDAAVEAAPSELRPQRGDSGGAGRPLRCVVE